MTPRSRSRPRPTHQRRRPGTPDPVRVGGAAGPEALLGAALTDRRAVRIEQRRWRRDQLAAAFEQTLRYLLRAANLRSEFTGGRGRAVLRRNHQRDWFNDLVEAQVSIRTAVRYCDRDTARKLRGAADKLDEYVSRLVSGDRYDQKGFSIWAVLNECIKTVTEAARLPSQDTTRHTAHDEDVPREFTTVFHELHEMSSVVNARSPMVADEYPTGLQQPLDRLASCRRG